jgi:nucleoside 2-deoxyribosyltransferase
MRVYLGAPYAARDHLRPLADELRAAGFTVTSTWLDETHQINAFTVGAAVAETQAQVEAHVVQDFSDLNRTDVLVVFTGEACSALGVPDARTWHTGGRHVETGFALAKGKRVLVIGHAENVFHRGACRVVRDWHAAVLELVRLREATTERRCLQDRAIVREVASS